MEFSLRTVANYATRTFESSSFRQRVGRVKPATVRRVCAGTALLLFMAFVTAILYTAYRAATDAYIAPLILSPDNDLVIEHKQKIVELVSERELDEAQLDSVQADLAETAAEEKHFNQLLQLQNGDLATLDAQRSHLQAIYDRARELSARAEKDYMAELITRGDLDRAEQDLHQAEIALLENRRSTMRTETTTTEDSPGANAPLELLKVYAAKKAKIVEQKVLLNKIAKLKDLEKEMRARPIALAMDKSVTAAFVPYTQLRALRSGAKVYDCVWGVLWCHNVGRVTEIVPGEVTTTDPWDAIARGQYVILDLHDATAARSKTLRAR